MTRYAAVAICVLAMAGGIAILMRGEGPAEQAPPAVNSQPAPVAANTDTELSASQTEPDVTAVAEREGNERTTDEGSTRLFSEPEVFDEGYRDASDKAAQWLNTLEQPVSRSRVLVTNEAAISEFLRQIETNPEGLSRAFDVSAFGDAPCIVSSIDRTSPKFTPGGFIPGVYQIYARCDDSSVRVYPMNFHASVMKTENSIVFSMNSLQVAGSGIRKIEGTGYSLAYQHLTRQPSRRDF